MIVCDNEIFAVCAALHTSHYQFYLTGSRYFGHSHENSDYDFFVQADPHLDPWLEKHGFVKESKDVCYHDLLRTAVYKHHKTPVHIQVVADVNIKIAAQEIIWVYRNLLSQLPKPMRTEFWNVVIASIYHGRGLPKIDHKPYYVLPTLIPKGN